MLNTDSGILRVIIDFHCYLYGESDFGPLPSENEKTLRETDKQKRKVIRSPNKAS